MKNFQKFLHGASIVSDLEELTNLSREDYFQARENPNTPFYVLERTRDRYVLLRDITLKIHDWQFFENENLEVFDMISEAVKRCENEPEVTRLTISIPLDPTRKSVSQKILETYINKEKKRL
ncbi:MAG: hypothetical protein FWC10_00825 [Lentimicrobiaceae bacterium]|nr:hypothetical protein [Lentimicrobiaceae bacterium]